MTRVDSVKERTTCVKPLGYGIGIGAASGLAMKYLYPVTNDEKSAPSYRVRMAKLQEESKQYTPETEEFLTAIKQKATRTPIEDVFVSSFDGMRYGERISPKVYDTAMGRIKGRGEGDIAEMANLFKELKRYAKQCSQKYVKILNTVTRYERPTTFFMSAGALVGAFIGMTDYLARNSHKKVS